MSASQKHRPSGITINNPLLSASVTGLTFDDFPNKPLLLPAAPPTIHAPTLGPVVTSSCLAARDPKTLVTVGSASLDTENLDEINLNSSTNEDLQTADITISNPIYEASNQDVNSDSILSQAASSFSALPSVASNVFSTFSKRITAISSRETTPVYEPYPLDSNANTLAPELVAQSTYNQQEHPANSPEVPTSLYSSPLADNCTSSSLTTFGLEDTQTNLASPEPPKFYTPAEVPPVPSITAAPPTNLGGQNNFRFSSKKKVYAPVPGLSDQSQKPITTLDPSTVSGPVFYDTSYASQAAEEHRTEDQKLGSGLFSKISNLAPTGVLQNITGLVQSAAGTLAQNNKTESYQQAPSVILSQQNNNFDVPQTSKNYFASPPLDRQQPNTEAEHINTQNTIPSFSPQQTEISNFFTPPPVTQVKEGEASFQTSVILPSQTHLGAQINPSSRFQTLSPPLHPQRPPSAYVPPEELSSTAPLNTNPSNPTESVLSTPTQVVYFDPSKYLPPSSQINTAGTLPPTAHHKLPPPTSGQHTSYRLQKGTKLYKNLLAPQATNSPQVTPNQLQAVNQPESKDSSQQNYGYSTPQSVPLFTYTPVSEQTTIQSVPLNTPPPATIAPFFTPVAEELKSKDPSQTIQLFNPSFILKANKTSATSRVEVSESEEQAAASFAPPIKKIKSDESVQNVSRFTASTANNDLNKPKTNELEHSADVEIEESSEPFGNKCVTDVPKEVANSGIAADIEISTILKPIESVPEAKLTDIQKEKPEDPLEKTLKNLSLAESVTEGKAIKLPPIAESFNLKNPYRKSSAPTNVKAAPPLPTLANFFAPQPSTGSADFNFFTSLPTQQSSTGNEINFFSETAQDKEVNKAATEPKKTLYPEITHYFNTTDILQLTPIEPHTTVQPPISAFFPKHSTSLEVEDKNDVSEQLNQSFSESNVQPHIGFGSFTQLEPTVDSEKNNTTTSQTQQPEIVNRFSNYFNQKNRQPDICKDSSAFFDSIPGQNLIQPQHQQQVETNAPGVVANNEEQRIQYFFNNPPPKDANAVGDLNYDLIHSGLAIKNLQQDSQTSISNVVEPPSSACSEFSEISNSTTGQKSIITNLSNIDNSGILIEEEQSIESVNRETGPSVVDSGSIKYYEKELPEEILKELQMANVLSSDKSSAASGPNTSYKPAVKHWFFKSTINDKKIWIPFSHYDSALLETSLLEEGDGRSNIVPVEGGRYDVHISERKKMSVYWDSQPIEVRRCSWFYKALDSKYVPYEEETADLLENEYKLAAESGVWHQTIPLGMGEQVVFHGPTVIVHFQQQQNSDAWGGSTQTATRPRVVKRDLDDFHIEQGESQKVDHLLFMVHGIGSACDLKLRSVEEVVGDFRTIARQLVQSHYKNSTDLGLVGRVEVLPISWHSHLHSAEMGIDEKLRLITLESIPKLRNFTNDTLLDILFYTSPTFCQKIMNTIVSSMNSLYSKYRERNPEFSGGVSLAGHSLGSLILFDLLCHQNPIKESEEKNLENPDHMQVDPNQLEDKQISYTMGPAGTGQPFINYKQLIFQPKKFFALGSPIGMFVTIRGIDKLGLDFRLPTCPGFYNIFHPYDPVAYRIEALVNPDLSGVRPVLIPHHKGRKRMHLELKETMTRVTMDLKNRFLDKFKTTLDSVNIFGSTSKSAKEAEELMEKEVDKVIQMQMQLEQQDNSKTTPDVNLVGENDTPNVTLPAGRQRTYSASTAMSDDMIEIDFPLGKLNDSKRIDYVLQEAPLEFINEYIFALSSHVCYWDSEDTILFVMKEIYSGLGISPDSQVPQQTMTIERPSSRNS